MKLQSLSILLMSFVAVGCGKSDYSVALRGIDERTAAFNVVSMSATNANGLTFELTFTGPDKSVILVDTVEYDAKKRDGTANIFLQAGDSTVVMQPVPEGATSASGRVISAR